MPDFVDTSDFLAKSTILTGVIRRENFDPSNPRHLESLQSFIRTGEWGSVQFFCEQPFSDVPMTVLMKYASYNLGIKRETLAERQARMANAVAAG